MSYSFRAKGASREAALVDAKEKMDAVVSAQSFHDLEAPQALAHASALAMLMPEPDEGKDFVIDMSGGGYMENGDLKQLSANCNISYAPQEIAS